MKKNAFTLFELLLAVSLVVFVAALIQMVVYHEKQLKARDQNSQVGSTNIVATVVAVNSTNNVDETNNSNIHPGDLVMIKGINVVGVVNRKVTGYFDVITTNGPHTVVTVIEGLSPEILVKLRQTNSIKTNIVQVEKSKQ